MGRSTASLCFAIESLVGTRVGLCFSFATGPIRDRVGYSYRRASIGESRDARAAG